MTADEYIYRDPNCGNHHSYLLPALDRILLDNISKRIFEIGCGNGSVADWLSRKGYDVVGVDPSEAGIGQAIRARPHLKLSVGSAYDPLSEHYGVFPIVLSFEVIEHLYFPRKFAAAAFSLLEPGGMLIISTPYHGYWKNLALAITGKFDSHFTALWDHGHIKFWSIKSLTALLTEAGFYDIQFSRIGRVPQLAKSMIGVARKA
jgi:2-polyprenyl-3-methyl-5-hydroxy-6-metoxy-1,4-benzoquinol methylase